MQEEGVTRHVQDLLAGDGDVDVSHRDILLCSKIRRFLTLGPGITDAAYSSLLRHCGDLRSLRYGRKLHRHIARNRHGLTGFIGGCLVQMYGRCGSPGEALSAFDAVRARDSLAFSHALLAAAELRDLQRGKHVHECIGKGEEDSSTFDVSVQTSLLHMYGKCGSIIDAIAVFNTMPQYDAISMSAMIAAYAHNGHEKAALDLFFEMAVMGIQPTCVTFLSALKACANLPLEYGRLIHDQIITYNHEANIAITASLITMYGRNGSVAEARAVFNSTSERNVIIWTAIIAVYAQNGLGKEAIRLAHRMEEEDGVNPDAITFLTVLDACTGFGFLDDGKRIHSRLVASGCDSGVALRTALLNMYGSCGSLTDARVVFNTMPRRNIITWTVMITAYARNGHSQEALKLFRQMERENIEPTSVTFLSILDACVGLPFLENGRSVHERIMAYAFDGDVSLMTALINMYGKCGSLNDARSVFDKMNQPNVYSWTAIINAYGQNGNGEEALKLFQQMGFSEGVNPDQITILGVLNACSHAGLLLEGRHYFACMGREFRIAPTIEHYVCMIDMFGRVGCLEEAEHLIDNMPLQPDTAVWISLLGACQVHGDIKRGARAAERILELDPKDASPYILLSNLYAASCNSQLDGDFERDWLEEATRVQSDCTMPQRCLMC